MEAVKVLATFITSKKTVMARDLARLAGCIMCIMIAVGLACCIRTRSMYRDIQSRLKPGDSHRDKSTFKRHVHVSAQTQREAVFWASNVESFKGCCLRKVNPDWVIDCVCKSDASAFGWGGFIQIPDDKDLAEANAFLRNVANQKGCFLSLKEIHSLSSKGIEVYGAFTPEQQGRSSTWRELYSVLRILQICAPLLKGVSFYLYLDNVSAVLGLGGKAPHVEEDTKFRGGSKKDDLQELIIAILDIAALHDMQVRAFWIAR